MNRGKKLGNKSYLSFIIIEIPSLIQILTLPSVLTILLNNKTTETILTLATLFVTGLYLGVKSKTYLTPKNNIGWFLKILVTGIIVVAIMHLIILSVH